MKDQTLESPSLFSHHAALRAARRNLVPDQVEYVLIYGRQVHRTGVTFYFLGRSDIPPADRRASWATRLEGTVVLLANDGQVITVYRHRRALRKIQRKRKYWAAPDDIGAERFDDDTSCTA